nr:valine--tRNA ligase [uncultured archaeon]
MESQLDINTIHKKWQKKWEEEKEYEPKAGEGEKFYLTAAFPYPNSPQHIGHARTYTTTDIYARFQRMLGKNVLFPMAFHVTGTPIFGMAKRLEAQDEEILSIFEKIYNIPREKAKTLTDARELVLFFSKEIEAGMREIGYSIDWRRKFYSFDENFNKFIEWQFAKLKQAKLIEKGTHPVPWCPKEGQAVGGHTYRPETLPGVTNLWANKDAKYLLAEFEGKKLYMAQEAFESLCEQIPLTKIKEISAEEILSLKPKHPLSAKELPILPASFVKPQVGTGLVMSVPAHAPFDYLALRDAQKLGEIQLIQVLEVPDFTDYPAKEIVEKMDVKSQEDERAEEATKILYKKEAHEGKMLIEPYKNLTGAQAKEKISADLISQKKAFNLHVLANSPLYTRAGNLCTVKTVQNQWFINYGNEKWKEKARLCLENMRIVPENLRKEFEYIIGWLEMKACTRAFGFGTKFPFDKKQMIEALSDSTIYMAYYTIAQIAQKMQPNELSEEYFDFVFLGLQPKDASKITQEWREAQKEFAYWYPLDSRHSAIDLVTNHLSFFIFNHVAIFDSNLWPKQIVANGFVTMEGKKMSKSMGNILPLRDAISKYGADVVRFVVTSTAEIDADCDFNSSAAEGVISRLHYMHSLMLEHKSSIPAMERDMPARWLYSRLHSRIEKAKGQYENFQLRHLSQAILYDSTNDLQWYLKRTKSHDLREFFEYWALLCTPFMPHLAEEFWESLGKKEYLPDEKSAALSPFPQADEGQIDSSLDAGEDYIRAVRDDILHIKQLIKLEKPQKITLIVHAPYKQKVRELVATHKDMKKIMQEAKEDSSLASRMGDISKLAPRYLKQLGKIMGDALGAHKEIELLEDAKAFFSAEFSGAEIQVLEEEGAPEELAQKASNAQPNKPSIIIS